MALAEVIAAAVLLALVGGQREFGIGGGAILCVPEAEIDADLTPYTPNPKRLQAGGGFAFAVATGLGLPKPVGTLRGSLAFVDDADPRRYPSRVGCNAKGCARTTLIDGFVVTYEVRDQDPTLIAELDQLLRGKIADWRHNCHATDRL